LEIFDNQAEQLTFFSEGFERCGSTQVDIRLRGLDGEIYSYNDFILDTGVDCPLGHWSYSDWPTVEDNTAGAQTNAGYVAGPLRDPHVVVDQHVADQVPEPATAQLMLVVAISYIWWVASRK